MKKLEKHNENLQGMSIVEHSDDLHCHSIYQIQDDLPTKFLSFLFDDLQIDLQHSSVIRFKSLFYIRLSKK